MDTDKKVGVLKNAIQIIITLFASFGGFLLKIAPPNGAAVKLPLGIAQILSLALLLYLSAFSVYSLVLNKKRFKRNYRSWLIACSMLLLATTASSFGYFDNYQRLVIKVPNWDTTFIRGQLTQDAIKTCSDEYKIHDVDRCENTLLGDYYTIDEVVEGRLWSKDSMRRSEMKLLIWYIGFVVFLSGAIFSALELLSSNYLSVQSKPT
ncbi:MAG TPA: hypothetical protein VNT20_18130 [Flavisolibacter sp.]|jgi:hypothetical protein|nr:hypothetical protein [Flavisolibacter sp.]